VLNIPGGTVRSRINRARGMLKRKLQPLLRKAGTAMNCTRARRLFGALLGRRVDAGPSGVPRGAFFTSCPRCRTEYDQFSRTLEVAGALPRLEAGADFAERALARARRSTPAPDGLTRAPARWVPATALATAAALIVTGVLLVPRLITGPSGGGPPVAVSPQASAPGHLAVAGWRRTGRAPRPGFPCPSSAARRAPRWRRASPTASSINSEDVEFILEPVAVRQSRRDSPADDAAAARRAGEQAVITF